jgi:proline iminopeptidase
LKQGFEGHSMINRRRALAGGLVATAAFATANAADDGVKMIPVVGGKYRVWTKRVGQGPVKVLLLHGGPGLCHDYLEVFERHLAGTNLEIYFYDQLGCGNSDKPTDTALWTVDRYRTEVEEVRQGLGLEQFVLYGHSWGGLLGIEYALAHQDRLQRLVISNMTASCAAYVEHAVVMRAALPAEDQATLAKYEAANDTDNRAYKAVIHKLNAEHVLRLHPYPEPVHRAGSKMNTVIYNEMQGPNEFRIIGNLKDWDRWADLHKIKVDTLVMGARYDEMDPDQIRREGRLIPNARTWISERGSHMTMWDDESAYFAALIPFLQGQT